MHTYFLSQVIVSIPFGQIFNKSIKLKKNLKFTKSSQLYSTCVIPKIIHITPVNEKEFEISMPIAKYAVKLKRSSTRKRHCTS